MLKRRQVCLRSKSRNACGFESRYPQKMKIIREKRIRKEYTGERVEKIVTKMIRSVTGEKGEKRGLKTYRNICQETGRARGVVREATISRLVYRALADMGRIEGVKRAS